MTGAYVSLTTGSGKENGMQETKPKTVSAVVVGRSGDKSIKVAIDYLVKHPKYGKYMKKRTHFGVHDERNEAVVGDVVEIAEGRNYSKTKSWRLVKVVRKAVKE
jgi:small subunit ribosomal protein S17